MNYEPEIKLLSKIVLVDLPKSIYGRDPKEVVRRAISVLEIISGCPKIDQKTLNNIIQIHQDADILVEHLSGKGKIEIEKVYKSTLKVLRNNVLHNSEEVDEAIRILNNTFDHKISSFRITGNDDKEIKGNADGLRNFAVQLLKVSTGKLSELNEDWFSQDRDSFPTIITLNYYDKTKDNEELEDTWKDKAFKLGCSIIGIFIVLCCFIGFVGIIKWILN